MDIPSVALAIRGGDIEIIKASLSKGDVIAAAKEYCETIKDASIVEVRVVCAIGAGIQWRRSIRPSVSAPLPTESVADDGVDPDEEEAKELRRVLREAKVGYSPRAGIEHLRKQVAELRGE